ncbi:MAG: type II toxin-antitoxin system RelE/ParE family toxin [Cyanobacteria bacterium TGS_CYA1]|nr:type II toxin-antitoxin system RelE/ParE family toxin [Cyanobacteria bacterium TGS_CYA1]
MKPINRLGNSKQTIREFPEAEKRIAGKQLLRVQKNMMPNDWKPMGTIGPGVVEIRIHAAGEYRVIYVSKFPDAIYVLSAFQKKTRKTPRSEILRAKKEYEKIKYFKVEK